MSAWIVESGHIDVIVSAARQYRIPGSEDPQILGQRLWHENHRSVNHLYDEQEPTPRYVPDITELALNPGAVLKALGCYDYQSCEHPGWKASGACAVTKALKAAILAANPDLARRVPDRYETLYGYHQDPAYNAAPWGFEGVTQALATAFPTADRA